MNADDLGSTTTERGRGGLLRGRGGPPPSNARPGPPRPPAAAASSSAHSSSPSGSSAASASGGKRRRPPQQCRQSTSTLSLRRRRNSGSIDQFARSRSTPQMAASRRAPSRNEDWSEITVPNRAGLSPLGSPLCWDDDRREGNNALEDLLGKRASRATEGEGEAEAEGTAKSAQDQEEAEAVRGAKAVPQEAEREDEAVQEVPPKRVRFSEASDVIDRRVARQDVRNAWHRQDVPRTLANLDRIYRHRGVGVLYCPAAAVHPSDACMVRMEPPSILREIERRKNEHRRAVLGEQARQRRRRANRPEPDRDEPPRRDRGSEDRGADPDDSADDEEEGRPRPDPSDDVEALREVSHAKSKRCSEVACSSWWLERMNYRCV